MIDETRLFSFREDMKRVAFSLIREVQREEQAQVEALGKSGFNYQRWHAAFFTIWIAIAREWGPIVEEVIEDEAHKAAAEAYFFLSSNFDPATRGFDLTSPPRASGLPSELKQFGTEEATVAEINAIVTEQSLLVVEASEAEWIALGEGLWGESQATQLAANNTVQATGWTQHSVATGSRLQLEKIWQAITDDRTRPTHLDANGQRRLLNDPFDVGGAVLQWPADAGGQLSEIINCRCWEDYELLQPPGLFPRV